MKRRELAFLLIGLGLGLMLSVAVIVEIAVAFHHMFIVGIRWSPGSALLAVPFLLVFAGILLLRRGTN